MRLRFATRLWRGAASAALLSLFLGAGGVRAAELVDLRVGEHRGFTRVVFELDEFVGYRLDLCAPTQLIVSMPAGAAAREIAVLGPRIRGVAIESRDQQMRARFELANPRFRIRELLLAAPPRIVIDVLSVEAGEGGVAGVPPRAVACEPWDRGPDPRTARGEFAPREADRESSSRISNEPHPLRSDEVPLRPFALELGNPFLGRGAIWKGFELPTGAVWQPSLLVFGSSRVAVQGQHANATRGEAVARLDLFANLQLSGTERFLVGIRPLDRDGEFTGYRFLPDDEREFQTKFNARIRTLFFEGDFGEIFPVLDPSDSRMLDFGVAVGRQPIRLQEGLLVDDTFDSVGLVRNNLHPLGTSNLRITALYGWDEIHRGNNQKDRAARLYALLTSTDLPWNTLDVDLLFVESRQKRGGDGVYAGLSSVQRIRSLNTALRVAGSLPLDGGSPQVGKGVLLFGELSWTPPVVHDLLYLNAFWGIGDYTSAARDPDAGGPLGRTGILFEAYGIGALSAPLGNDARRSAGGALGYQMFLGGIRRQLVIEVGGRRDTLGGTPWAIGGAMRFQQALGRRHVVQIDVAVTESPDTPVTPSVRLEWRMQF